MGINRKLLHEMTTETLGRPSSVQTQVVLISQGETALVGMYQGSTAENNERDGYVSGTYDDLVVLEPEQIRRLYLTLVEEDVL